MNIWKDFKKFITETERKEKREVITYLVYYFLVILIVFLIIYLIIEKNKKRTPSTKYSSNYSRTPPKKNIRNLRRPLLARSSPVRVNPSKLRDPYGMRVRVNQERLRQPPMEKVPPRFKISQVMT